MPAREYRFADFVLRPDTRELLQRGQPLRLGRRAFDLLQVLVEHADRVVSREELFARAWAGRVVGDDNLKVQVMALRAALGADAIVNVPGVGYRFGLPLSAVDDAADDTTAPPPPVSSPTDALLGRTEELADVSARLRGGALLTVAGSGGVGKTRLALAAVAALAPAFRDGVAVVELAAVQDPSLVCGAIARQLKLPQDNRRSVDRLAVALAPLSLLLVLDNCEHLVAAVAETVAAVLAQAPGVAVLATSQEPLGIQGESVVRLAGLAMPPPDATLEALRANPAAQLLIERALSADRDVALSPADAPAIAALAIGLDGIPLALELAAARVPLLGWEGTRERLDQQLKLLTRGRRDAPSRHQTLRATLQWSHALLAPAEQALVRRLGVFADTFTVEAAERVAGSDADDALNALQALVDKSLVQRSASAGASRLRLLVTTREFALERLAEAGELEPLRARHADAVAGLHERAQADALQRPLLAWVDRMTPELADLRAALAWAAGPGGDARRLLRLVSAAGYFWNAAGLDAEAQHWLTLARPLVDAEADRWVVARYWAAVAHRVVDPTAVVAESLQAAQRAAELFHALGDAQQEYRMLGIQAHHGRRFDPPLDVPALLDQMKLLEQPDWSNTLRALRRRCESIALARAERWKDYRDCFAVEALQAEAEGDDLTRWGAQHHLCLADIALGEPGRAADGMRPVVERLRELGYLRWQWTRPALYLMALIEAEAVSEATAALRETLPLLRVAGAVDWLPEHMGLWALLVGAPEEAARLLGWSDTVRTRGGTVRREFFSQRAFDRLVAATSAALGEPAVEALRSEGRAWSSEIVAHRLAERLSGQAG
jgi:predicted ATPase